MGFVAGAWAHHAGLQEYLVRSRWGKTLVRLSHARCGMSLRSTGKECSPGQGHVIRPCREFAGCGIAHFTRAACRCSLGAWLGAAGLIDPGDDSLGVSEGAPSLRPLEFLLLAAVLNLIMHGPLGGSSHWGGPWFQAVARHSRNGCLRLAASCPGSSGWGTD